MFWFNEISGISSPCHACDKAIPATRHCFYESLPFHVLAQRLSKKRNILRETTFFNKAVRPKPLHQFFFSKQAPAVFDKRQEHIECFRCERHNLPLPKQQALLRVEAERAEFV